MYNANVTVQLPKLAKSTWFDLLLTNADKPSLDPSDAVHRLEQFGTLENITAHWGIVLTNAPVLFK
jgi:hypothetical protein